MNVVLWVASVIIFIVLIVALIILVLGNLYESRRNAEYRFVRRNIPNVIIGVIVLYMLYTVIDILLNANIEGLDKIFTTIVNIATLLAFYQLLVDRVENRQS